MPDWIQKLTTKAVASLQAELKTNLASCCLYGSAVRGTAIEGRSDLNLLILLHQSTPEAHEAVARALEDIPQVDPFILSLRGFDRSVKAFAIKFASIRRHYRVLYGDDPLKTLSSDPALQRFLCEQAVRNLRLRLVFAFVTRKRTPGYGRFLVQNITPLFVQLSETVRLSGTEVPKDFKERIPLLERHFGLRSGVLADLLAYKESPHPLTDAEMVTWHRRVFPLIDALLVWIESHWNT